tara:strand:- start:447 stop:1928 length:1482 start_codon:yes stop_codon:yes gene_type:complete
MDVIRIIKVDEVYVRIDTGDAGIHMELYELFTFKVPGFRFHPDYKNKTWDGSIHIYSYMRKMLYAGLVPHVIEFAKKQNYKIILDDDLKIDTSVDDNFGYELSKHLKTKHNIRDYQNEALVHTINNRRSLLLCPTASGKSFIIYLLSRYHNTKGHKILIIVPQLSLVEQMRTDFIDYMNDNNVLNMETISRGKNRDSTADIVISTWQSIHRLDRKWFDKFDVVIGDEAHLFKAKSLTSIMTKLVSCPYRYGFTGTIDKAQSHKLVLEGLFGKIYKVTTTKKLIDKKVLADLDIKIISLKYKPEDCKYVYENERSYQEEIDWIVRNKTRLNYIKNLACNLEGNSLILFQFVEKHGKPLLEHICKEVEKGNLKNKNIHFVYGKVSAEEREEIRNAVEKDTNAIIVASYGTYSTGVDIPNLNNVVFCSPSKSRIRVFQSIGRGLRRNEQKTEVTIFDVVDDLKHKRSKNYALKHFEERLKMYDSEQFNYKLYKVNL